MKEIKFTLLSEGSSDESLIPILKLLLIKYFPNTPINSKWADLRNLKKPPKELENKILLACEYYNCNLLFIHRDSDGETLFKREQEIIKAVEKAEKNVKIPKSIAVIPVKMLETWLLIDEKAIRFSVGNPYSKIPLNLPKFHELENKSKPKEFLNETLKKASGYTGRKLKKLNLNSCKKRIADRIENLSPLQKLSAFQELEKKVRIFAENVNQEKGL